LLVHTAALLGEDPYRPNMIVGAKRFGGTNSAGPLIPAAARSYTRCANGQCRGAASAVIAGVDIDHPEDDQR
jgi:hypothetical protein